MRFSGWLGGRRRCGLLLACVFLLASWAEPAAAGVTVSIDPKQSVDPSAGPVKLSINVSLSGPAPDLVTAQFECKPGTATSPADYIANSGTVYFPPGITQATIAIDIPQNPPRNNEYFTVELSPPTGDAILANFSCRVNIEVPAPPPITPPPVIPPITPPVTPPVVPTVQFSMASYSVPERAGVANITVTLSAATTNTVSVKYKTADGTATAGEDYAAASDTLIFLPGVVSQTFAVTVYRDLKIEGDETVLLTLSEPTNAVFPVTVPMGPDPSTATLTIIDCPPILKVTPTSYSICAGGLHTAVHQATVTVELTDGMQGFGGIPLALSKSEGSLAAYSGTTNGYGIFITTLTSDRWTASMPSTYGTTVTVIAQGSVTQSVVVAFDPPLIKLSSDVTTIAPGGKATLTVALTFQEQPVADHRLSWTAWDESGNRLYNAITGSRKTNGSGVGTAMFHAGYGGGTVKILIQDTTVFLKPKGHPSFIVMLVQEKSGAAIFADLNRDGKVNTSLEEGKRDDDSDNKAKLRGTIVIANKKVHEAIEEPKSKDGKKKYVMKSVYDLASEPAKRREIIVTSDKGDVWLRRNSTNLGLFTAVTGGKDLFNKVNEITVTPKISYWLEGGETPSTKASDHWLEVRKDQKTKDPDDKLNVTVLWAEISVTERTKNKEIRPSPFFDGYIAVTKFYGHGFLGVERATEDATGFGLVGGLFWANGLIEIVGDISPSDLQKNYVFNEAKINFKDGVKVMKGVKVVDVLPATADFGFIFRRRATVKNYKNGETVVKHEINQSDDSDRISNVRKITSRLAFSMCPQDP